MLDSTLTARREFLKFLAASPYVAALGGVTAFLQQRAFAQKTTEPSDVISDPAGALNVFDFEEAAHRKVQPGHWAYMASGVDDDATLRANREGFNHIQLRPRRLRDATKVDMRVDLFGTVYNSPIFLCPTGAEKSFYFDGEIAVARAAKAHGTLQFLSTSTSSPIEDVNKALGRPVWYQLYAPGRGMPAKKCCGGCKPRDVPSSRLPSTTRRAATVKRTCAPVQKICASVRRAMKGSQVPLSRSGRCTTGSAWPGC